MDNEKARNGDFLQRDGKRCWKACSGRHSSRHGDNLGDGDVIVVQLAIGIVLLCFAGLAGVWTVEGFRDACNYIHVSKQIETALMSIVGLVVAVSLLCFAIAAFAGVLL